MTTKRIDLVLGAKDRATRVVDRVQKRLGEFARRAALAGVAAGTAAAGGLAVLTRQSLQSIDATAKFADRIGIGTEALAGLQHAAELTGVASGNLDMAMQRMTRRVAEAARGSGEAVGALQALGIDAQKLAALSPDQQFKAIADAMAGVESQSDRVRLAFKLFDSGGVGLVNTLALGRKGLEEVEAEARRLGLTFTREQALAVEAANDAHTRFQATLKGLGHTVAIAAAPALTRLNDLLADGVVRVRNLDAEALSAAATYAAAAAAAVGWTLVLPRLAAGLGVVTTALHGVSAAALAARVASVALHATLVGGLIAGLAFVTTAFIQARIEGITFGEAVLQILDRLHLLEGLSAGAKLAADMERAESATHKATVAVQEAEAALAGLDDAAGANERFEAQQKLVQALEMQIRRTKELKTAERALLEEEVQRKRTELDRRSDIGLPDQALAFHVSGAASQLRKEIAAAEERLSHLGENVFATGLTDRLDEAKDRARALRDELGKVPDTAAGLRDALVGPTREATEMVRRMQRLLENLQPRVLEFTSSPFENEVRRINQEAQALKDGLQLEVMTGDLSVEDEQRKIRAVEEARQRAVEQVRDRYRDSGFEDFVSSPLENALRRIEQEAEGIMDRLRQQFADGLLSEAELQQRLDQIAAARGRKRGEALDAVGGGRTASREGVEAMRLSSQFTGVAARFQAGLEPAKQTARNTRELVTEMRKLREEQRQHRPPPDRSAAATPPTRTVRF